ncbi:sensor histidine kinase [Cellulomonas sp. PhB150]|uniref:sensor histidine kinase n=1 Tax=Cellulomonas sp. PhB150 TaxID=2485188 RepID=UPI000F47417D|nr:sensor histidine kinase [Cellulomonas sp. PhB150]ROS23818.1 signal transduction histidine kinase [Cellulomonas sp. PhB150]
MDIDCPPPRLGRVLAPALAVLTLVTALTVWAAGSDGTRTIPWVLDALAGLAALAVLLMVTSRPLLAGVLLGALAAVSPAATPAATAGTLVAARWFPLRTAVPVALASVVGHAIQGLWLPIGMPYGWWLVCDVAVHAALLGWGAYGRARATAVQLWRERAQRAEREQASRVEEARVAERTRIAREMHDSLAHRLSLLATTAGALEYRPDLSPEQVAAAAGVVRAGAGEALEDLRAVIGVLREQPDELRPAPGLADLPALVAESRAAGIDVDLRLWAYGLPPAVDLAAYRVAQEGLTNALRHAPGAAVRIHVDQRENGIEVEVLDRGGRAGGHSAGAGVGLVGLRERVELLGGALSATPTNDGWVLSAWIPA